MRNYTAWLKHDKGNVKISVWAVNRENAKQQILALEKCPERSIQFLGVTPSKKEIKQAKAWGY